MELIFGRDNLAKRGRGLTFDDVLLVPQYSEITSRRDPDLSTKLTKNFRLNIPIMTSNMDTITGREMAIAMAKLGGIGILHRFMSLEDQIADVLAIKKAQHDAGINTPISASIGVKQEGTERTAKLIEAGVQIVTIDIAHGDSKVMLETLEFVKKNFPHVDVIAGNIATPAAAQRLIDAGADAIKVGIGPGSMCTTRIVTGHGLPQLTAIAFCVEVADKYSIPVIADGGLKTSGDIVKALAAGASTVMLGSMVAGTSETPGVTKKGMKEYRGMASKAAQVSWKGELPKGMAAEGESTLIPCKGNVEFVIDEITGGIRSGMTYMGVDRIEGMRDNSQFIEMSLFGMNESKPHGVHR